MGNKEKITGIFNVLTGASSRHNRALREVSEWAATVQKFLNGYDLYGKTTPEVLIDKIGEAKIDLTSIAYNGRPLMDTAKKMKGPDISPLVSNIITSVENLRRFLIKPTVQSEKVTDSIKNLRSSYEKLRDTLAKIELM